MIVVDASVLAPALSDDGLEGERARDRLQGETLAAPELVVLEVASVIRRAHQVGLLAARRCQQALGDLLALTLSLAPHEPLLGRIWELRENATVYDSSYIALAELTSSLLLTADAALAGVPGIRCPVELIGG